MSQQIGNAEKNLAEGSAAMADKEIVSIAIPISFFTSIICTYFFIFFRKLPPTPLTMRKKKILVPAKEHPLHHPPPVMM